MTQQLSMYKMLFPPVEIDPCEYCTEWLLNTRGCSDYAVPIIARLFAEFGRGGFDRAKALPHLCGDSQVEGLSIYDAERLGFFDSSIDYHLLWDRLWAMRQGVSYDDAMRMTCWDYSAKAPIYGGE